MVDRIEELGQIAKYEKRRKKTEELKKAAEQNRAKKTEKQAETTPEQTPVAVETPTPVEILRYEDLTIEELVQTFQNTQDDDARRQINEVLQQKLLAELEAQGLEFSEENLRHILEERFKQQQEQAALPEHPTEEQAPEHTTEEQAALPEHPAEEQAALPEHPAEEQAQEQGLVVQSSTQQPEENQPTLMIEPVVEPQEQNSADNQGLVVQSSTQQPENQFASIIEPVDEQPNLSEQPNLNDVPVVEPQEQNSADNQGIQPSTPQPGQNQFASIIEPVDEQPNDTIIVEDQPAVEPQEQNSQTATQEDLDWIAAKRAFWKEYAQQNNLALVNDQEADTETKTFAATLTKNEEKVGAILYQSKNNAQISKDASPVIYSGLVADAAANGLSITVGDTLDDTQKAILLAAVLQHNKQKGNKEVKLVNEPNIDVNAEYFKKLPPEVQATLKLHQVHKKLKNNENDTVTPEAQSLQERANLRQEQLSLMRGTMTPEQKQKQELRNEIRNPASAEAKVAAQQALKTIIKGEGRG